MKPALSVIFFTVSSGAGLGLLVWLLIASLMADHIRMDALTFYKGAAIAALLITAGLISSTPLKSSAMLQVGVSPIDNSSKGNLSR